MKNQFEIQEKSFSFELVFSGESPVPVSFSETITPVVTAESYAGPYEVVPKTEGQTLETADKLMARDVTVQAIPFYKTSNQSGGYTATIAMTGE